jgi:simple sugar transport system ATP-binding protein
MASPKTAINLGIGMVHQQFMLIPTLTVAENIILMSERGFLLKTSTVENELLDISKKYGLEINPKAIVGQLSEGEKQRVEIVRTLYRGADILVLDEPTSVLIPQEIEDLFKILKSIAGQGRSVIFITHKLKEVFTVSDRVTVLRNGNVIDTVNTSETDKNQLAKMMVGRDVDFTVKKPKVNVGKEILNIDSVSLVEKKGLRILNNVSLSVREGEILGIAGVAGNGQSELAQVVMGILRPNHGKILVENEDVTGDVCKVIKHQVGYIPEERRLRGLFMDFSLVENLILKVYEDRPYCLRKLFLNYNELGNYAEKLISEYDIKTPNKTIPARHLSGGNVQKLIIAREFSYNPQLLIAENPTVGLDVGATEYVHSKLLEQRNKKVGILMISTDLDEIMMLSDRIAVMHKGEIMGMLPTSKAKIEEIGLMMAGEKVILEKV